MPEEVDHIFLGIGRSMLPLIPETALIEWESTDPKKILPGELVIYVGKNDLICHQVMFRRSEKGVSWYFIKGNHLLSTEGWIPDYRILGKPIKINQTSCRIMSFRFKQYLFWSWELLRYLIFVTVFTSIFGRNLGKTLQKAGISSGFFSRGFSEFTSKIYG